MYNRLFLFRLWGGPWCQCDRQEVWHQTSAASCWWDEWGVHQMWQCKERNLCLCIKKRWADIFNPIMPSFFSLAGDAVRQVESCMYLGLQRQDNGLQFLQVGSEKHPVLPSNEEPGATSWSRGSWPGGYGDECWMFCFPTLRKEAQDQTGLFKGYV